MGCSLFAVLIMIIGVSSCDNQKAYCDGRVPPSPGTIFHGRIKSMSAGGSWPGAILEFVLEDAAHADGRFALGWVSVTSETILIKCRDNGRSDMQADLGDITPGKVVDVWMDGLEFQSNPPQFYANVVIFRDTL
jgi:hypothetical protein